MTYLYLILLVALIIAAALDLRFIWRHTRIED